MNPWLPRGRNRWAALLIGVAAFVACGWAAPSSPHGLWVSYLFVFVFFTGLSLGSLALVLIPVLTGGEWGELLRPSLMAAIRMLWLQIPLAIPIVLGMHRIYPWADPRVLAQDAQLRAQSWFLNPTFFCVRMLIYFILWLAVAVLFERRFRAQRPLTRVAAIGLIIYGLTASLASVDWIMSLEPHWHSTVFGLMVAIGWMLAAAALAILTASTSGNTPLLSPLRLRDLGNLLLALVLGWAYLAFMQYLTVWLADLPAETSWYIPRTLTSWRYLAGALILGNFAIPFSVLLLRRPKQRRGPLRVLSGLLLVASLLDALWLVAPDFRPTGFQLQWEDLLALLGMGGLWFSAYLGHWRAVPASQLGRQPLAAGSLHV